MDVTGAGTLFMSAEYAVKAVIVEHYGFLPPSFKTHHRIVNLSHLIGLWWQLPSRRRFLPHGAPIALLVRFGVSTKPGEDHPVDDECVMLTPSTRLQSGCNASGNMTCRCVAPPTLRFAVKREIPSVTRELVCPRVTDGGRS
jgi:hypothetical protein